MVAGVNEDGLARQRDAHHWAVDQLARLERGEPVDRLGLASLLRQRLAQVRTEARACIRALVKAQLLLEHGPVQARVRQGMAALRHHQALHDCLTPSLSLELGAEWPRLYRAAAAGAAEELRDLGGDPDLLPRMPLQGWMDFLAEHDGRTKALACGATTGGGKS